MHAYGKGLVRRSMSIRNCWGPSWRIKSESSSSQSYSVGSYWMRGGFFNGFGGLGVEDSICFWPGFFLVVTPSGEVLPFLLSGIVSAINSGCDRWCITSRSAIFWYWSRRWSPMWFSRHFHFIFLFYQCDRGSVDTGSTIDSGGWWRALSWSSSHRIVFRISSGLPSWWCWFILGASAPCFSSTAHCRNRLLAQQL